jgi:sugar phosphate isomerase/epimerase
MKRLLALIGMISSAAVMSFAADAKSAADFPIGLQLYSLRGQFLKNVPETVKFVADAGIKEVELAGTYSIEPAKFRQMLQDAGLKAVSGHFGFDRFEKEPAAVAQEAKALGLKFAGTAWIPHEKGFDEADVRRAVEVFNRAGEELAKHGIQFFYHCHGYEFQPYKDGTFMDHLIRETDPKNVAFEMDTLWVFMPGQDPAAWLRKYPGRWQLLHLKDLKKGVATGVHTGGTDKENNVVLGTGQLNWPDILAAAREVGVKHYFIEDESSSAPAQIPQSVKYLKGLGGK